MKKLIINYRIKYNKVAARERLLLSIPLRYVHSGWIVAREEGAVRISEWNEAVTQRET